MDETDALIGVVRGLKIARRDIPTTTDDEASPYQVIWQPSNCVSKSTTYDDSESQEIVPKPTHKSDLARKRKVWNQFDEYLSNRAVESLSRISHCTSLDEEVSQEVQYM